MGRRRLLAPSHWRLALIALIVREQVDDARCEKSRLTVDLDPLLMNDETSLVFHPLALALALDCICARSLRDFM